MKQASFPVRVLTSWGGEPDSMRQAMLTLHVQGIFPSHHKVRALLSDPNLMRMPEASATWHAVRRELGLER